MTKPLEIRFVESDAAAIADVSGRVVAFVGSDGAMSPLARRVNRLTKGMLKRVIESDGFGKLKAGEGHTLSMPVGMAAEALLVVKLDRRAKLEEARKAGAAAARFKSSKDLTVLAGNITAAAEVAFGLALTAYRFDAHKTKEDEAPEDTTTVMVDDPEAVSEIAKDQAAVTEGVFFTRDLTNEPANILTTNDFAARLAAMQELGLEVEILEEDRLEELGMRTLLAVGQGSASPSKVVVMSWNGGSKDAAPLALVGKGVVFDTGGISL